MTIGSGIGAQLMVAEETSYGVAVAPTRSLEFVSEGLMRDRKLIDGEGLYGTGVVQRDARRSNTTQNPMGPLQFEFLTRTMGVLLKHWLGSVTTTTLSAGVYLHQFTVGDLLGRALTLQVGVPQETGTVFPKNLIGGKVGKGTLSVAVGEKVMLDLDIIGRQLSYASPALGTAAYVAGSRNFNWAQGAVLSGTPAFPANALITGGTPLGNVRDFSLDVTNNLSDDRYNQGNNGLRSEPLRAGYADIQAKFTTELTDTVLRDAFESDTSLALVETFTGASLGAGFFETLQIGIPALRVLPNSPQVKDQGIILLDNTADVRFDGTNPPVVVNYVTADPTP